MTFAWRAEISEDMMKKPTKAKPEAERISKGRREVTKKASYVIPAVLSLAVTPSFAAAASAATGAKRKT
jgi:hypothetical protein